MNGRVVVPESAKLITRATAIDAVRSQAVDAPGLLIGLGHALHQGDQLGREGWVSRSEFLGDDIALFLDLGGKGKRKFAGQGLLGGLFAR